MKETHHSKVNRDKHGEVTDVNEYHIIELIGTGSTASAYLCEKRGGAHSRFALKVFEKSMLSRRRTMSRGERGNMIVSSALDQVSREIAVMKKLEHSNLVRLFEVIDDENEDQMFMVLEFVEGGTILDWNPEEERFNLPVSQLKGPKRSGAASAVYAEEEAAAYTVDILRGLKFLHQNHIAHRDLKPENVLITRDGHAKIADFGVAHYFQDEEDKPLRPNLARSHSQGQLTKTEGTYYFWAPEMCDGLAFNGYAADLWALGVCVFCMVFGALPFSGSSAVDLFDAIQTENLTFPSPVSEDCADFLSGLLNKDPDQRLSLEEAVAHPWLEMAKDVRKKRPSLPAVSVSQEDIDGAFGSSSNFVFHTPKGMVLKSWSREDMDDPGEQLGSAAEVPTTKRSKKRAASTSRLPKFCSIM